jgi:phosphoglycerate dehydrogenase-like enzyme
MALTIWTNAELQPTARAAIAQALAAAGHRLLVSARAERNFFAAPPVDPMMAEADVAFGQPDAEACLRAPRLRWLQVTTAGYTRYDTEPWREAWIGRRAVLTNASSVFAEPCAQHALAMILGLSRRLPETQAERYGARRWLHLEMRAASRLLDARATVLLLGYGAIARRLVELLAPFGVRVLAVRRKVYSERGVHVLPEAKLTSALGEADHIVNLLPENESTRNYVNARRLSAVKPGAFFYNLGRGATVDERALAAALVDGRLSAAYLDVFAAEPLPSESPLWDLPNCYITPHSAGGRTDQDDALVELFLRNLNAFTGAGEWRDRVL